MNRQILQGDVLVKIKEIKSETIDVIISSPPYWGLRDYGVEGQLGLEPDFRDYLKTMGKIMQELKRVLKKTGTCWINLGDTYAGGYNHSDWAGSDEKFDVRRKEHQYKAQAKKDLAAKSRYAIPERFYVQCIDDGWIARNHIPWYKSNSMPSSVKDRFTNKWESVFFFAKEQKYYFNLDSVRESLVSKPQPKFNIRVRENITGHAQKKLGELAWTASEEEMSKYNKDGTLKEDLNPDKRSNVLRLYKDRVPNDNSKYKEDETSNAQRLGKLRNTERKQDNVPSKNAGMYEGFNDRWKTGSGFDKDGNCFGCGQHYTKHSSKARDHGSINDASRRTSDYTPCNPKGKNPGDVFFINPQPFPEAHFATFPVALPLRILKCAAPPGGIVLDPFFGSGTVGVAAEKLGLRWVGIELNSEYIKIARERLDKFMMNKMEEFF